MGTENSSNIETATTTTKTDCKRDGGYPFKMFCLYLKFQENSEFLKDIQQKSNHKVLKDSMRTTKYIYVIH